jgi:three-Cys-motif partner protein
MTKKKSSHDRLMDQLNVICDKSNKDIFKIFKENSIDTSTYDNEYKPHTILKLSYLSYYMGIFLPIARKHFNKVVFIDAFSGSGLVKINGSAHTVLGSSLLAATAQVTRNNVYTFDQIISIDKDKSKVDLLDKRFKALQKTNANAIYGDANEIIKQIPRMFNLDKNTIILLFIDPEGMEPILSEFINLFRQVKAVDTITNYTWGVYRLHGRIIKNMNETDITTMQHMIPDYVAGENPDEKLYKFFEETIGKPIGDKIDIHDIGKKVSYSLILRINDTKSHGEWLSDIEKFGKYLSTLDDAKSLLFLNQVFNEQRHLDV